MMAGEASHPRKNLKRAFKTIYLRFGLFFIGGALACGIVSTFNVPLYSAYYPGAELLRQVFGAKNSGVHLLSSKDSPRLSGDLLKSYADSLVVPYNDPTLNSILSANSSATGTAASSPYVIAMQNLGVGVLPHLTNALLVTSIFSAGNSYV